MLQLLHPAGLWTLAALALPLAVHLWRPPPQTVHLGSLRFLEDLPHRRLRNLRWRERTLLATRLALLAALALLVAGLRWQPRPSARPARWILLDPAAAPAGASAERLRRLQAEGWTTHRLAPGLPFQRPEAVRSVPAIDLWSALREADPALPAGSSLAVFTSGRIAALRGSRPALAHCRVEWIAAPDAAGGADRSWVESAGAFAPAGQAVVAGTSGAMFTRFDTVPGAPDGPPVEFSPDRTRARVAPPGGNGAWVPVAPLPAALRVVVAHDAGHAEDARYLAAAVRAAAGVAGRPLALTVQPDGDAPPAADWLFWLADRPAPDAAPNVVADAGTVPRDLPATMEGWIVPLPDAPGAAGLFARSVRLWRRTPAASDTAPGETLWTDAQDQPLLTLRRTSHGKRWTFHSRFHPDWTDLPRTAALAAWARDLLFPSSPAPSDSAQDLRLADPAQYSLSLSPAPATARTHAPDASPDATDLHWPLWCLAAVLFAAERFLSRPRLSHPVFPTPTR